MKTTIVTGLACLFVGACLALLAVDLSWEVGKQHAQVTARNAVVERNRELRDRLEVASSIAELDAQVADGLLQQRAALKRLALMLDEAEQNIQDARVAQKMYGKASAMPIEKDAGPVPEEAEPPEIKFHPKVVEYLGKATALYEQAKAEVDKLAECGDVTLDFQLNYLKGEVYHRCLQLLGVKERQKEFLGQALQHYKKALRLRPADANTMINIELLAKESEATATAPQEGKKRLLMNQVGGGNSKGN